MTEEDLLDLVDGIITDQSGSPVNSEFIAEKIVASLRSHGLLGMARTATDPGEGKTMDITIKDLGTEAIDELLAEAADGMKRRTGKAFTLELDLLHGDLKIKHDGKHVTTANVRPLPFLVPVDGESIGGPILSDVALAMRYRSNLRRNLLEATQAITPVPGASDVPAALVRAFNAISALEVVRKDFGTEGAKALFGIGHDLWRIVDHLTGNDHSGCSGAPSVSDYGRDESTTLDPAPPSKAARYNKDGFLHVQTQEA